MPPLRVDLVSAKEGFRKLLPPIHPARIVLEEQADSISETEFQVLFPLLIRLAGTRVTEK